MPTTTRFQNAGWEAIATAGPSNVCTLLTERIPACACRLLETLAHLVLDAGAELAQLAPRPTGPAHRVGQLFRTEDYEGEDQDDDHLAPRQVEHDASVEIRDRTSASDPGSLQGRGQPVVAGSEAVVAGAVPAAAVVGASPSLGAAAACCDCAHASAIFQ